MASSLRTFLLLAAAAATTCLGQSTNATSTTTTSPTTSSSTVSSSITCATGLHLIVARGSTEPKGLGRIGVVAGNVTEAIPGSTVAAVDYPATFDAYFASVNTGVAAMSAMIAAYVTACPSSKIALLGYSQGGQVAMDVVCGTSETLFTVTPDLGDAFKSNSEFSTMRMHGLEKTSSTKQLQVIAVVTFGDPSHMVNQTWDEGTSNHNGVSNTHNVDYT